MIYGVHVYGVSTYGSTSTSVMVVVYLLPGIKVAVATRIQPGLYSARLVQPSLYEAGLKQPGIYSAREVKS